MRRLLFILSAAAMLSAVSCEYDFELKDMPQEPVLCMECLPGLSDTTFVRVRVAVPVGNADVALPDVSGVSVGFSVNGEEADIERYSCVDGVAVYYSLHEVACGDVLELSASLDGVSPVSSGTVVPGAAPEFDVAMEVRNHDLLMTVSVADDPVAEDFYAVTVFAKERMIDSTSDREIFYKGKFGLTDREAYPDLSNSGVLHMDEFMSFFVFDDRGCSAGGVRKVHLQGIYSRDEWFDDGQGGKWGHGTTYQVRCSRLSAEAYRYLRSRYEVANNELAYLGWAPGNFAYTNISGGLGVFGSAASSSSGWLGNI